MNKIRKEKLNQHICEWCEDNSEDSDITAREIRDFVLEKGGNSKTQIMLCQECYYMYDQEMADSIAS